MKTIKEIMVVTVLSSSLFAGAGGSKSVDKVSIAKDNIGDFLVAPAYIAEGKVCSETTLMNVYDDKSILVKIAIREQIQSDEVDLPVFLSPNDVWDAKICDVNGKPTLFSCDDSNHPDIANELCTTGINLNAHSESAGNGGDFHKGYIEYYPIAQYNEGKTGKVEKKTLVSRWDELIKGNVNNPKLNKDCHGVHGYGLTGFIKIQESEMQLVAFKGTSDKIQSGKVIDYSNDTSPETLLGVGKTKEILNLLSKRKVFVPYNNFGKEQYVYLSFIFDRTSNQSRKFEVEVRDMEENTSKIKRLIISPAPRKLTNSVSNELGIISLKKIIDETRTPENFEKGMITIKEVRNEHSGQLGSNKNASFLPTKVTYGQFLTIESNKKVNGEWTGIKSWSMVPTK